MKQENPKAEQQLGVIVKTRVAQEPTAEHEQGAILMVIAYMKDYHREL